MIRFSGQYYDGQTSKAHTVEVSLNHQHLKLTGKDIEQIILLNALTLSPPVGSSTAIIYGSNHEEIHTSELQAFDALAKAINPGYFEQIPRFLEARFHYALAALVFSIACIAAGVRWGMPALALVLVELLPANFEQKMGSETLAIMDKVMLASSELPEARRNEIRSRLKRACKHQPCPTYILHFRRGQALGANAFALPSGDIVITDELILLAETDEEILSVLFHELGHVKHHHSLRLAIQSAGAATLLIIITGDFNSTADLIAGLPSLLVQKGYQRDMEREADLYSLQMLQAACIAPQYFADIMSRLSTLDGGESGSDINKWVSLLESHPNIASRIKAFKIPAPLLMTSVDQYIGDPVKSRRAFKASSQIKMGSLKREIASLSYLATSLLYLISI